MTPSEMDVAIEIAIKLRDILVEARELENKATELYKEGKSESRPYLEVMLQASLGLAGIYGDGSRTLSKVSQIILKCKEDQSKEA
jgi:hypothetical protein